MLLLENYIGIFGGDKKSTKLDFSNLVKSYYTVIFFSMQC